MKATDYVALRAARERKDRIGRMIEDVEGMRDGAHEKLDQKLEAASRALKDAFNLAMIEVAALEFDAACDLIDCMEAVNG